VTTELWGGYTAYGGGLYPDWMLKQSNDFFRQRLVNPIPYNTAIWWLGEPDATLPKEFREYVYRVSQDPIKCSITADLTTTGIGGFLDQYHQETGHPYWGIRYFYTAKSKFIQNNYLRLYTFMEEKLSVLEYDKDRIGGYTEDYDNIVISTDAVKTSSIYSDYEAWIGIFNDSNSELLSEAEGNFEPDYYFNADTQPASEFPALISNRNPSNIYIDFTISQGEYLLIIRQLGTDVPEDVIVKLDGNEIGQFTSGQGYGKVFNHFIYFKIDIGGLHQLKLELVGGVDGFGFDGLDIVSSDKKIGIYDNSSAEFKGEGVYEMIYTYDFDTQSAGDFPCGLSRDPDHKLPAGIEIKYSITEAGSYVLKVDHLSPETTSYIDIFVDGDFLGQYVASEEVSRESHYFSFYLADTENHKIKLRLARGKGHKFDSLSIIKIPVQTIKYSFAEPGGQVAVLEEEIFTPGNSHNFIEKRIYTLVNDTPWMKLKIIRDNDAAKDMNTVLGCEGYEQLIVDGITYTTDTDFSSVPDIMEFKDVDAVKPDLVMFILNSAGVSDVSWISDSRIILKSNSVTNETLEIAVMIPTDLYTSDQYDTLKQAIVNQEETIAIGGDQVIINNPYSVPVTKIVKITDPDNGPYFIKEYEYNGSNEWWSFRGAQVSKSEPGKDFVKVYLQANKSATIQRYGFIDGVVKNGWGSQYHLSINSVQATDSGAGCKVEVYSITPFLFAPRIEFAQDVKNVKIDGYNWYYFDENFVFLPNRPGTYEVEVNYSGEVKPHLTRTFAFINSGSMGWNGERFNFTAAVPDWVSQIPGDLKIAAAVSFPGYEITSITGATIEKTFTDGAIIWMNAEVTSPVNVEIYLSRRIVSGIGVSADPSEMPADGVSISTITAELQDNGGSRVGGATNRIEFSMTGEGTLDGTNPLDAEDGIATIRLLTTTKTGTVTVSAESVNDTCCLRFKGTALGEGNKWYYRDVSHPTYTTVSGDVLQYDIYIPASSAEKRGGIDIEFPDKNLRDSGATDQNGVFAHPSTNLSAYALDRWYHREILIPDTLLDAITAIEMVHEADSGTNEFWIRNLKITNGAATKLAVYNTETTFDFPEETTSPGNNGYTVENQQVLTVLSSTATDITINHLVIDDFESYMDPCNPKMLDTWAVAGNASASLATDLSHEGDKSMKVIYATGSGESAEVSRATPFVDWTQAGVEALTLFFHGVQTNSANAQQLYVKLEDGSTNEFTLYYDGDADDIVQAAEEDFVAWDIDLDDFTNVIQTNITKISIGMAGSSSDTVYYDDIRLYTPRCFGEPLGDLNGDCVVDWKDFAILARNWLETEMWP
jgi:hypothetical protein